MNILRHSVAAIAIVASSSATAGEEVLYQPTPDWVDVAKLDSADGAGGTPLRLLEQQVRLEDGTVWTYIDNAVALESPEALTALGTLSAQWFPDKGNLIIHRVELMRDGQVIDVLAGEARFEAIRRERGLENRMLDGELTATMPLPGAQIGDIMRMSYSTTLSDQALGDHMQWTGVIITEPMPLAEGRIIASWPVESEVSSQVIAQSDMGMLEEKDGYRVYSVELPAAEPKDMPGDAPQRFRLPPMVQFSSYDSWEQLSREMEPLFATDGGLDSIPELVAKVSEITSRTDDSLERAALATQLVQDEISYLLNGLNGGNYIPQTIGETWDKRYGDCKAKTLLLLTMLRKMDIEANALLVQTVYGDALPQILPMPGNFDHLIVHARIGGEDYWLDGTGSGTRLDNIADVPRFFYGLPLKPEGANLVEMVARPLAVPAETIRLTIDQSAGIAVPALFDIEVDLTGASAAAWKAISQMEEAEVRDNMIDRVARNVVGSSQVTERAVSFDDEAGTARINLSGLRTTPWRQNRGIYENNINFQLANGFSVDVDRARKEWREIPVVINAPIYEVREIVWSLPDEEFTLEGSPSINQMIAGNTINSEVKLDIGRLYLDQSMRSHVWELEAAELPAAKRETARLKRALPTLKASRDARRSWDYRGKHRKLLKKLEDAYAKLIEDADDDDASAHANRAGFRAGTGDFQGALEDLNEAIARAASTGLYYRRASAHQQLGDLENALSDLETAEELQGNGASHGSRIEILGLLRRGDEALALAEEFALIADDFEQGEQVRAFALGWAGQAAEGLTVLRDIADTNPEDANQLNEACWYAGIWNMVDEDILAICTAAVERGGVSAPARDSRALALYRLGRSEEAVTELDEVLSAHPDQHASRYLRGIIRTQLGDEGGRDDINSALWAAPSMKRTYTAYGLGPA